jgi:hypothetical protein
MSNTTHDQLNKQFDRAERIGVVGSPSTTRNLTIDILGTAADKRLVGSLCIFRFMQDSNVHYALEQITETRLRNVWSEDPTMRGPVRQRGIVEPVSGRQDIHTAIMTVSAVFSNAGNEYRPSLFGAVPSTGTSIRLDNQIMNGLLTGFMQEIFYLGKAYGSSVLLPMWSKHFGFEKGGAGEAYHIGIFGKNGSGKSVLAKMVMMGYARKK